MIQMFQPKVVQPNKDRRSLLVYLQAEEATGTKEDKGMRKSSQTGTERNQCT